VEPFQPPSHILWNSGISLYYQYPTDKRSCEVKQRATSANPLHKVCLPRIDLHHQGPPHLHPSNTNSFGENISKVCGEKTKDNLT
jgi:hypothetical protein